MKHLVRAVAVLATLAAARVVHADIRDTGGTRVLRPFRTAAYWGRYLTQPASVAWTVRDNDEWEWTCWEADA